MNRFGKRLLTLASLVLTTLLLCFALTCTVFAAPMSNVPMHLVQPDGSTLDCFASGDEFFNYLHDSNGNLIIRHPKTGYYVYATTDTNAKLVASDSVALSNGYFYEPFSSSKSPARISSFGITVNDIDFTVNADLIAPPRNLQPFDSGAAGAEAGGIGIVRNDRVEGIMENVVVMICFADEDPSISPEIAGRIESLFNGSGQSFGTYMKAVSGGVLDIHSTLVGLKSNTVLMHKDSHPRAYYQPYNEVTNPDGYDSSERFAREDALLNGAINAINGSGLLAGKNLDIDGDGVVDSMCFIINGGPTDWSTLLWPHMSGYPRANLNGKRVGPYSFHLSDFLFRSSGNDGLSVICHESLHTFSYPDLYRYDPAPGEPVGAWDIMAADMPDPQIPNNHTRLRYAGWGDGLVEITENGRYTLAPVGSKNGITAYAIATQDDKQFILLEYRSGDNGTGYDTFFGISSYYRRGLTIARVNTSFNGNSNRGWTEKAPHNDEVYIYRPGETAVNAANGSIQYASLSSNASRIAFGVETDLGCDGYIYLYDGTNTTYVISIVSETNETISFDVKIKPETPGNAVVYISSNNGSINATYSSNPFISGGTVANGSSVAFSATPDLNHIVDKWIVDGVPQSATGNTFTLGNITSSKTVTVTFKQDPTKVVAEPVIVTDPLNVGSLPNNASVNVTITTTTPGATIYYTLDGTMPTTSSAIYTGSFMVTAGTMDPTSKRIIAYAANGGNIPSGRVYKDIRFEESSPEYRVVMSELGTYVFPMANLGYNRLLPKAITIINEGIHPTGTLTLSLSGENPSAFVLSANTVSSIAVGNSDSFSIAPAEGLPIGTYSAIITMGGANGISGSFTVRFSVEFLYPMVSIGNPQYVPVTSDGSLILNFNTKVTAVPGARISIWAMEKRYEHSGTAALPVCYGGSGFDCDYSIPPEGLEIAQTESGYTVSIPFSSFIRTTGTALTEIMESPSYDPNRAYYVSVPTGSFFDDDGVGVGSLNITGAFFSKYVGKPGIRLLTPYSGAIDVATSGEIVIGFNTQMDIAMPGTVSLSLYIGVGALAPGSWSEDGKSYTVEYSGLQAGRLYTVTITGFSDMEGNVMDYVFIRFSTPGYEPPVFSLGNPQFEPATSDGSLILNFNTEVTIVPGNTITIWAFPKEYEYAGTTAIPVRIGSSGYTFTYTIPSEGLEVVQTGDGYTVSIPFSLFGWVQSPGSYFSSFIASSSSTHDRYRAYSSINIPSGTFINSSEVFATWSSTSHSEFFSRSLIRPVISTITPANGATGVSTSGEIEIVFSKQMDKATQGTIALNPSIGSVIGGSWSADGRTYTASYSGLQQGTSYTVTISGFNDPDDNVMAEVTSSFTTEGTSIMYGDVNGDGRITAADVTMLLQYLAEWDLGDSINLANADVNGDGRITAADVTLLLQYLAEWDVVLGPKES